MRAWTGAILAGPLASVVAGCSASPPPSNLAFEGLPVSGSRAFAESRGFSWCVDASNAVRCRRQGVMLLGEGPYEAAVDLQSRSHGGGFRQLTIWHEGDQRALYAVGERLKALGWQVCRTGREDRGDQEIWRRDGSPVRVSIDISYWGKRRLRLIPEQGQPTGACF